MKRATILVVALCLAFGLGRAAGAEPMGTAFTYQGRLMDANDTARGVYDMMFHLYDSPEGPSEIGVTDIQDVEIPDGYFTVALDFGSEVFSGDWRWLEISIRPGDSNDPDGYIPLNPRQQITPTPYALYAKKAGIEVPLSLTGSKDVEWIIGATNNGNGPALGGVSTSGYGVRGQSTSGYGIIGTNTGGNYGYLGGSDYGVYGQHAASGNNGYLGGSTCGAYGYNSGNYGLLGTSSYGVYGNSGGGAGVYGADQGTGNYGYLGGSSHGVYGSSSSGYGVYGSSDSGTGVYGEGDSGGVYGYNSSGNYGFLGCSSYGVYGNSSYGYGVYGFSENNYGVIGHCNQGYGVYGRHESSGNYGYIGGDQYGVYGKNESSGNYGYIGGATNGGYFRCDGESGRGAYCYASGGMGIGIECCASNSGDVTNYGGYFVANGKFGRGAYGKADGISGVGLKGEAGGDYGVGVLGYGGAFDFLAEGPGDNYGSLSSIRWKSNVEAIDKPLEKILQLEGVYFDWDAEHGGEHDVGMIAEEVGEVLPEIVQYEEDGIYTIGMDYSKLTPLLVEAVKTLKTKADEQQRQIHELQDEISQLKELLSKRAILK